jgi:hypothetical protein
VVAKRRRTREVSAWADQGEHARIAAGVVGGLEKDQAGLAAFASPLEFPLCRRKPIGINAAVLAAEQAHVELATVDQAQIEVVGAAVAGGQVFKQHRLEEAPQQGIPLQEVAQGQAFGRELLLHAADEDAVAGHRATKWAMGPLTMWTRMVEIFMAQPLKPMLSR